MVITNRPATLGRMSGENFSSKSKSGEDRSGGTAAIPITPSVPGGFSAVQREQLERDGYTVCRGLLDAALLREVRDEFDRLWTMHGSAGRVHHQQLLVSPVFLRLIEHAPILTKQRELFGDQVQLLSLDLLRQDPASTAPDHGWHRDFVFPGDHLIAANTILYLDDINASTGQTKVVPGTHRGRLSPPAELCAAALPGQVLVEARAGDATVINAAVWHSGGRNRSPGQRRAIYLYYGWWWLKQYFIERGPIPWQSAIAATPERLALLGLRMPGRDLHMY